MSSAASALEPWRRMRWAPGSSPVARPGACFPSHRGIPGRNPSEIARNSVESKRPSELIDYATLTPFAIGLLETAFAIDDSSIGIWR